MGSEIRDKLPGRLCLNQSSCCCLVPDVEFGGGGRVGEAGGRCRFGLEMQRSQTPFIRAGQKASVSSDGGMKRPVSGPAALNARSVYRAPAGHGAAAFHGSARGGSLPSTARAAGAGSSGQLAQALPGGVWQMKAQPLGLPRGARPRRELLLPEPPPVNHRAPALH